MDAGLRQMQNAKYHGSAATSRRTGTFQVERRFVGHDADPNEADLEIMQMDITVS